MTNEAESDSKLLAPIIEDEGDVFIPAEEDEEAIRDRTLKTSRGKANVRFAEGQDPDLVKDMFARMTAREAVGVEDVRDDDGAVIFEGGTGEGRDLQLPPGF